MISLILGFTLTVSQTRNSPTITSSSVNGAAMIVYHVYVEQPAAKGFSTNHMHAFLNLS